jgi:hypothetical protein
MSGLILPEWHAGKALARPACDSPPRGRHRKLNSVTAEISIVALMYY